MIPENTSRPRYTRTSHVRIARRADGSVGWYSVPESTTDAEALARVGEGSSIATETVVSERAPCDQVIFAALDDARDAGLYEDGDDVRLSTDMRRFLNSTPDAGRPSDAARTVAREYRANPAAYRARFDASRAGA